ncbi:lantibiotic dehydratase C-terminal domain-containing protein [Streptomyces sp. NPDC059398]|uniref:lantibiotic dehydratase C-terminal domain-containing protein n=1 Tax=Streptomyces sp. NPDC059398 TaxID=3346820 RepID=UPI00369D04A6
MLTRLPGGAAAPEPAGRWVSAHVFTGHPLDLVVSALIPPVVAELRQRGLADQFFFLRHWQGGPHLRLRVRLTTAAAEPAVRAALEAHTTAVFRALPPSQPMTADQYRSLAAQLTAREPESEPGGLAPNDSLAFHTYRPEHGKYGHGAALRAAEDAFATCSELATDAIVAEWSQAQRTAHCFALLAATTDPGVPPGRPAPDVRAQYRTRRAALLSVAHAARTAAPPGVDAPAGADPVSRWLAACRSAQSQAAFPARLAGHLSHLACNRLGIRLGQEAGLRALALLAVTELTEDDRPLQHSTRRQRSSHDHARHDGADPP